MLRALRTGRLVPAGPGATRRSRSARRALGIAASLACSLAGRGLHAQTQAAEQTPLAPSTGTSPQPQAPPPSTPARPASGSTCCLPFIMVRGLVGGGALAPVGQGPAGALNFGADLGVRFVTGDLTGIDASGYLTLAGSDGGNGALTLGLAGSIGWMPSGLFSISYAPGVLLGLQNGSAGVGMRNAVQLGTLADVFGLELGYDFVHFDAGYQHAFRAVVWFDPGLALHLLIRIITGHGTTVSVRPAPSATAPSPREPIRRRSLLATIHPQGMNALVAWP